MLIELIQKSNNERLIENLLLVTSMDKSKNKDIQEAFRFTLQIIKKIQFEEKESTFNKGNINYTIQSAKIVLQGLANSLKTKTQPFLLASNNESIKNVFFSLKSTIGIVNSIDYKLEKSISRGSSEAAHKLVEKSATVIQMIKAVNASLKKTNSEMFSEGIGDSYDIKKRGKPNEAKEKTTEVQHKAPVESSLPDDNKTQEKSNPPVRIKDIKEDVPIENSKTKETQAILSENDTKKSEKTLEDEPSAKATSKPKSVGRPKKEEEKLTA